MSRRYATAPELDLGRKDILDHGFIRLVSYMGDDDSVVRSARVSHAANEKTGEDPEGDFRLINYLYRHGHTSPFEHVVFTFHVKAPIFVFRQWHRHRTWCLSGDSMISFELPDRQRKGIRAAKKLKLSDLACRWNEDPPVKRKDKQKRSLRDFNRERISNMLLRVYDEENDVFTTGSICDIIESGRKEVFKVKLINGREIKCSKDHRLLTSEGWKRLEECSTDTYIMNNGAYHTPEGIEAIRKARSGPKSNFWKGGVSSERQNIARWTREQAKRVHEKHDYTCQDCGVRGGRLHAHHIKAVVYYPELARDFDNLTTLCESCHHKAHGRTGDSAMARTSGQYLTAHPVRIKSITRVGVEDTYDISVEGPHHNFVANGMVVHNSYNEISARYTELPEEFYVPNPEYIGSQSKVNHQSRDINPDDPGMSENMQLAYMMDEANHRSFGAYRRLLEAGVPRELARTVLPFATYSEMFASVDLHNLFKFIKERTHPGAQYEIRVYAEAMLALIEPLVPAAVAAWKTFHDKGSNDGDE